MRRIELCMSKLYEVLADKAKLGERPRLSRAAHMARKTATWVLCQFTFWFATAIT
jgi:hypothetical protein